MLGPFPGRLPPGLVAVDCGGLTSEALGISGIGPAGAEHPLPSLLGIQSCRGGRSADAGGSFDGYGLCDRPPVL